MKPKKSHPKNQSSSGETFTAFLFHKAQRTDWLIIAGICLAAYIILKICYPYPAAVYGDSAAYVKHAMEDRFTHLRPFGYSYFLQRVYAVSASIHAVVIVQLLLYCISTASLAFTIKYFFPPVRKVVWYVLLVFLVFSPSAFFLANSFMSDVLFSALVYCMLAAFIFIVKKKSWIAAIAFCLSLFFSLHVRYSAMIFPFIFIPLLLMFRKKVCRATVILVSLLLVVFYNQIKSNMKEVSGLNQFSTGFDGCQLANNAMHILPYIKLPPQSIKDPQMRDLHEFSMRYVDEIAKRTNDGRNVTAGFLWEEQLPLKKYLLIAHKQLDQPYGLLFIQFGSTLFKKYGQYLILHYPLEFMRYYYLPNMVDMFYVRHIGLIKKYTPIEAEEIVQWYHLENKDVSCRYDPYGNFLAKSISPSGVLVWIIIAGVSVYAIINRKRITFGREEKVVFWGLFTFGSLFYASTIFASPIELRYWLPMKAIQFSYMYILLNKLMAYKLNKLS
ncbi:MAG: hypothetical protein LBF62_01325 [Tannerellaceae bacterium]|jgi:hypothetical protein|nr:hypothetical protein [Tannerellaceae bacterium]